MPDAIEPQQDFTELARQAFADSGFAPSDALLKAAAKGLSRLTQTSPMKDLSDAGLNFDEMLQRCAGA